MYVYVYIYIHIYMYMYDCIRPIVIYIYRGYILPYLMIPGCGVCITRCASAGRLDGYRGQRAAIRKI